MEKKYVLAYDIGTTGVKTCIFALSEKIEMLGAASHGYGLYVLPDGGVEQNPDEWWEAMCITTAEALGDSGIDADQIEGISFCSQMQGCVLVDKDGKPVRPAMSYMDTRAKAELKENMAYGPQIAGANVFKLLKSLYYTKAVSASVKDPVYKYKWVQAHEKENFAKTYKWLDVKEALICRMTGEFIMTCDSAFATLLYDVRPGNEGWCKPISDMLGVNYDHLAKIIKCTDQAGVLTEQAAKELGLKAGTPVFGGGGDATLIGIGAGAVEVGDTHIYQGTSGWVSTVVDTSLVDTNSMIAATVGINEHLFNYFAELETAGKCLEWVKDNVAQDGIGIYTKKQTAAEGVDAKFNSVYDCISAIIENVPAGSNGVMFTPWLHGNRCPFEDPNCRGMFFNLSLETAKGDLLRAVTEGVCYHFRWFIEAEDKKTKTSDVVRFVGGGALSPSTCQILADVTGKTVETVTSPQNAGAVGAAVVMALGLGIIKDVKEAKKLIPADCTYKPNPANKAIYDKGFELFKSLYTANKANFETANG